MLTKERLVEWAGCPAKICGGAWFFLYAAIFGIIVSNGWTNAGIVLFFVAWILKKAIADKSWPVFDNLFIFLAALILWAALSIFNSVDAWTSVRGVSKLLKYFLIFLAVSDFVRTERAFRRTAIFLLGVAFVSGLDGIFQHIAGYDFFRIHLMDRLDWLYRITASFHTPNDFAGYLVLVAPVFLTLFLFSARNIRDKALLAIPSAVLLFCLYRAGSRSAWAAFIAAVIFLSVVTKKRWLIALLGLAMIAGLASSPVLLHRAKDLFSLKQNTTWERMKLWQGAISMTKAHPVLGNGINTYNINFPSYRPADYLPDNRYAHNCYLQMSAEIGIVGVGIFLLFLFFGLRRTLRSAKLSGESFLKYSLLGLTAGALGFLIHSATDTNLYSVRLATAFWLGFGLMNAASRLGKPARILYVRTDRIGDLLLNTPALNALKGSFPKSHIAVLADIKSAEVLRGNPDVDEILIYDERLFAGFAGGLRPVTKFLRNFITGLRLRRLIAAGRYDTAIISNPSKRFHALTFLCGIRRRVGYNRKWGFLLTHKLKDEKRLAQKHEVEYNLELVGLIGAVSVGANNYSPLLSFPIGSEDEEAAMAVMKEAGITDGENIIAIHPGTSNPDKRWDPRQFARLAEKFTNELKAKVVLVAGEDEGAVSRAVTGESAVPIVDLTGKLSLKALGAFLKKTKLLVSSDSAPVHIAAAVGVPAVVLFAKGVAGCEPKRWRPWDNKSVVIDEDLKRLSADEVFNRANELFSG